jgi:ADP-L-glycero-D-manno-heptose 6-epimerase
MAEDLILVTGAAGFIGSNVVRDLADDHYVVACDHFTQPNSWRSMHTAYLHDILSPHDVIEWLETHHDDVAAIVHMGAISSTTHADLPDLIATNVRCTLDLWNHASHHGVTFIYASSAATYGDGARGFADDDSPEALAKLRPLNAYGWTKHVVDRRIATDAARGRPTPPRWAGLKFFNVYGPNEAHKGTMRSVVHQLYPLAARGETVRLFKSQNPDYPDGGQRRDFVYVKDCCTVVRNMLAAPQLSGIFNVGTSKSRTFADLASAVFAAAGRVPRIEYIDMPPSLQGRYQYFTEADISKLKSLDLAPQFHELESGVDDYVRSHLVHEFASS